MKLEPKYILRSLRVLAIVLGLLGAALLYRFSANTYHILVDGSEILVQTHATLVEAILERAGIAIEGDDQVYPSLDQNVSDQSSIEIRWAQPILMEWEDEVFEVSTLGGSIGEVISDADLTLLPSDRVWLDGISVEDYTNQLTQLPELIGLRKSKLIRVNIDGEVQEIWSAAPTLGEALAEAGFLLRSSDQLDPPAQTPTADVEYVSLRRAKPITIHTEVGVVHSWVTADTVGSALSEAGLALVGEDYSIPEVSASLPEDGEIRLVHVDEQVIIEQTPLPFETGYQPNPELEIDQYSIVEAGSYGVQARRVRVRFEDGEEVSREAEGEWVAREPEQRVIGYGTNIVIRTTDTPDGPISYWRAIRMYATSYSPSRAGVPDDWPWYGITACGKELVKGLVAIDNRYIPFHTMMYVPGYGFAEACDVGGGVRGRWIDLGYEDHNWENWHEYVTVYFLTPVPPSDSIAWIFP